MPLQSCLSGHVETNSGPDKQLRAEFDNLDTDSRHNYTDIPIEAGVIHHGESLSSGTKELAVTHRVPLSER